MMEYVPQSVVHQNEAGAMVSTAGTPSSALKGVLQAYPDATTILVI